MRGGGGVTDFLFPSLSCLSLNKQLRSSGGFKRNRKGMGEVWSWWRELISLSSVLVASTI
jgi:hypothetical protein